MKLALALSLFVGAQAFVPQGASRSRAFALKSATEETTDRGQTKKKERLRFMKSEQFHRRGFKEVREQVETTMTGQFESDLVKEFKTSDFLIERDGVKVHLAKVRLK
jgi:hypothetical protein